MFKGNFKIKIKNTQIKFAVILLTFTMGQAVKAEEEFELEKGLKENPGTKNTGKVDKNQNSGNDKKLTEKQKAKKTFRKLYESLSEDHDQLNDLMNEFFDKEFFMEEKDPFKAMEEIRKRLLDSFNGQDPFKNGFSKNYNDWFKNQFGTGQDLEITKREDSKAVYFEIDLKNLDKKSLEVKVEEGMVRIEGTQIIKKENKNSSGVSRSVSKSSFVRSFPVPDNVDGSAMTLENKTVKLILKFPKKII